MFRCALAAIALLCGHAGAVIIAQPYPSKPLCVVVAFTAGGPIDIVARLFAPRLGGVLGQQVVVDNRAGANGIIGTDFVAKSTSDGYNTRGRS